MALLLSPAAAPAQVGRLAIDCVAEARTEDKVSFGLDFERHAVVGAFPINWAWFARDSVLFGYSVQINGDYQTLQSYALDHATRTLEICDFASGGEQACERRACRPRGSGSRPGTSRSGQNVRRHQVSKGKSILCS